MRHRRASLHHWRASAQRPLSFSIVAGLSKQYGAPDKEEVSAAAGSDITAWHATFRFKDRASIQADADLHDADFTCTADLLYQAPK
jgi:hypothetical protein